jgi:pimeloyl-ACP methyl ester carboxylesterase
MKKFLKVVAIVLVALVTLAVAGLFLSTEVRRADPAAEALAALEPDSQVQVIRNGNLARSLEFRPATGDPETGVILYPGANCDIRGYAPLLRRIAAEGYVVVALQMPFDFSVFGHRRALEVRDAWPGVKRWVIVGHSMGGAMAAQFVHEHPDAMAGLVLWDAYPPDAATNLATWNRPVWSLHRARPDGSPPASFELRRSLLPPDSVWVGFNGGIHMYFGSFDGGAYKEEWEPSISRADQQDQIVRATLDALRAMTAS